MANKPSRDLWRIVIQNFWKSIQPRTKPTCVGEDYLGNKYYELPANPRLGKMNPARWYEPAEKEATDQETTAEWDSWLRGRRIDPPTSEEILQNLHIIEMKKRNAAQLDIEFGKKDDTGKLLPKEQETIGTFPKYDEYELRPGVVNPKQKN